MNIYHGFAALFAWISIFFFWVTMNDPPKGHVSFGCLAISTATALFAGLLL